MQKIIQIHPCLLKLSRKQVSVTDRQTDSRYYYIPHRYRGGIQKKDMSAILNDIYVNGYKLMGEEYKNNRFQILYHV
jgi:hypothetical protein